MDVLNWLEHWYAAQCDGDWEHSFGPIITTIDNPGWSVEINLSRTDCDGRTLARVQNNYEHPSEWWCCWIEGNIFKGAGGPLQLHAILKMFRSWATNDR
jgi:hypothetical protein